MDQMRKSPHFVELQYSYNKLSDRIELTFLLSLMLNGLALRTSKREEAFEKILDPLLKEKSFKDSLFQLYFYHL